MKENFKERAKSAIKAFVSAERWLEHLEEEIEPKARAAEKSDLDLVLKNSTKDFETFESLKRVRAAVKASDDVALPESGHYYDALHEKIMASIDEAASDANENVQSQARAPRRRVFISSIFGAIGATTMMALLAIVGLRQSGVERSVVVNAEADAKNEATFERKIAMVDARDGASLARDIGSFGSEEDFLTEAAAARLKRVSAKQAEAILRALKR